MIETKEKLQMFLIDNTNYLHSEKFSIQLIVWSTIMAIDMLIARKYAIFTIFLNLGHLFQKKGGAIDKSSLNIDCLDDQNSL